MQGCSALTRTKIHVVTAVLLCALGAWAALTHEQQLVQLATASQQQMVTWYHVFDTHVVPAMGWALEWVVMMVAAGWPPLQQHAAAVIWWCAGFVSSSMPHVLVWARAFGTRFMAAMHLAALVGGWCARAASFQPFLEAVQFSGLWVAAAAVIVLVILEVGGCRLLMHSTTRQLPAAVDTQVCTFGATRQTILPVSTMSVQGALLGFCMDTPLLQSAILTEPYCMLGFAGCLLCCILITALLLCPPSNSACSGGAGTC
jgi:hypothetical protein